MGQLLRKQGITEGDFQKAIQTFFLQVSPDGRADSGYAFAEEQLKTNKMWQGYAVLDVAVNAIKTKGKEAGEVEDKKEGDG